MENNSKNEFILTHTNKLTCNESYANNPLLGHPSFNASGHNI